MVKAAKKTDAAKVAGMAKLIPLMKEKHEQLGALIAEFEAIAGGGPTIGDKLREITDHWGAMWTWRYREPFAWADMATMQSQIKVLLKKLGTVELLKSRISNYIKNANPYYIERRHPWALFVRDINEHVSTSGAADESGLSSTPDGCRHQPPCRDQFEHTKKRQEEQTR